MLFMVMVIVPTVLWVVKLEPLTAVMVPTELPTDDE